MNVTTTAFTVAEYCEQMKKGSISVNHEYQRSPGVWPTAARSYLIDTMLLGYPIPKIALFQRTDVKSRKTIKEIVDGQQRSMAILDFYDSKLRITGQSDFTGKKFDDLELEQKQQFLEYSISTDLFVNATETNIRQMFRRMNSYTVPLNPEEHRHATHQGEFKWFIVEVTESHANGLKQMGVFSEKALARMQDAKLFTEVVFAYENGIETYAKAKLNRLYSNFDDTFSRKKETRALLDAAMDELLDLNELHDTALMKAFNVYSLMLGIMHFRKPAPTLKSVLGRMPGKLASRDVRVANLSKLAKCLEADSADDVSARLQPYYKACSKATNTKTNREIRFDWICRALSGQM